MKIIILKFIMRCMFILPRNENHLKKFICWALCQCADDLNLNEEVSRFNLEWSPLLSLPDNDMIDEDINYILLQINMSVPPENHKSHRCVLVAFACLHVYIFTSVVHIIMSQVVTIINTVHLLKHVKDICFRF